MKTKKQVKTFQARVIYKHNLKKKTTQPVNMK